MDIRKIKKLIEMLEESHLTELELSGCGLTSEFHLPSRTDMPLLRKLKIF